MPFNPVQVQGRTPEEIKTAEEKKRKEEDEKKKKPIVKQKKYYDIKVEAMVPCTLSYRVQAEDEREALEMIKNKAPDSMKRHINKKQDIKAIVYDAGSSIIRFAKTFRF